MSRKRKKKIEKRDSVPHIGFFINDGDLNVPGYTSLDHNPEIMTACRKIAELAGSITIHLMKNTERGDVRIVNELSRAIDIAPVPTMTRKTWMETIVMNLLLYGEGNSVVWPHTWEGLLKSLEPVAANRVSLVPVGYRDYKILVDGVAHNPENMLHFVYNPDKYYPWMGRGVKVSLKDIAANLKQAAATEKGFMESKWKPSLIVKVDAMLDGMGGSDEMSGSAWRQKMLDEYVKGQEAGQPWLIPAEQFDVQEVRPLSLADLAISDMVQIDKRAVASIFGIPPFVLGVGEYDQKAWNNFIQNTVRTLCIGIAQEMTRKLIINPAWYLKFNTLSLMDWDIETISAVFGGLSDKGIVTGNEVRDRIGMSPMEGLDELRILENYIPSDMIGDQKKLVQGKKGEKDGKAD